MYVALVCFVYNKSRCLFLDRPQSSCSADKEVEETLIRGVKRRKRRRRNEKRRRKNNSSAVSAISKATTKTKSSKQSDFADWDVASRFSFFSTRFVTECVVLP